MTRAEELIAAGHERLRRHIDRFSRYGDERVQARELLEYAAGGELDDEAEVDPRTRRRFESLVERRARGEPVPYIRGYEVFLDMRLAVKPGVFIPRETTEFLARQAIRRLRGRTDPVAADLACGVGAVALAIARELPNATVFGADISKNAVSLARANARSNGVGNVTFVAGSMFEPLPKRLRGSMDVIASHPPYVATGELRDLPAEVIDFEPVQTLTDSSRDGLGFVRGLVLGAREWLKPGGWLCVEIAADLTRPLRPMLTRAGYREIKSTRAPSVDTRVVVAKR